MKEYYSNWSGKIYPCSDKHCDFIGSLDAFTYGQCYDPCPKCGSNRVKRVGRFVYSFEPIKYLPFLKVKKFNRVEWKT